MTYPRSHLIDPAEGVYHVCSRCVRRAWLCGTDELTGLNFDHRRQWLESRILTLTATFGIDLYGYAVMSNHYHLVLSPNMAMVETWSNVTVVDKWLSLFGKQSRCRAAADKRDLERQLLLQDHSRLKVLRQRLSSISWLMRLINEPLARQANAEDGCKGRFWEGRFKSQRLLDDKAVIACMVYVDLNPVRAGAADDMMTAKYTSLAHRLTYSDKRASDEMLAMDYVSPLPFEQSLADYIDLVRTTGNEQKAYRRSGKLGGADHEERSLNWLAALMPKPGCWSRASGSSQSLKAYAKSIGQCWVKTHSMQFRS